MNNLYSENFANLGVFDALKESLLGICTVFLMLAVLIFVIWLMGRLKIGQKSAKIAEKVPEKQDDSLVLEGVDDKTAAMIMAIVADETKIPVNELYFKYIKEIK